MTRRDKWQQRPVVMRYREFSDQVKLSGLTIRSGDHILFTLPMPGSWAKKRKAALDGEPHQQTPDVDNLCKAILDALFSDDSHIWDLRLTKRWGRGGSICVFPMEGLPPTEVGESLPRREESAGATRSVTKPNKPG